MKKRFVDIWRRRYLISTQLYLALGSAVAMTLAASLVGYFSFANLGEAQSRVNEDSVPELTAAFKMAQNATALTEATPRLIGAQDLASLDTIVGEVEESHGALLEELASVSDSQEHAGAFSSIETSLEQLRLNTEVVATQQKRNFELRARAESLRQDLAETRVQLETILVPAVDSQVFYTMTGFSTLDAPPASPEEHFSVSQVNQDRYLSALLAVSAGASLLLESAFSISSSLLMEPLLERFESSAGQILRIQTIMGDFPLRGELAPHLDRLIQLGVDEEGIFNTLGDYLRVNETQAQLASENRGISVALVEQVDGLVNSANDRALEATQASEEATLRGQLLLIIISTLSVGGALLIAWLFVGRYLLRRLATLSAWMRQMASGDLEAQVEMRGHDEVAEMAAALEVFRQHALEVQRLNLVEELAMQIQGKNDELQTALSDLAHAQDQIVMREKLAALGELTAGVAHEIRNPLNFVKNFSEVSAELLEELNEVLVEAGDSIPQERRGHIRDISVDLASNLERIGSHTARANRIVHDMLMMGRDTGEFQIVEINPLVDEFSKLAYHSARATDSEFQLNLEYDLHPDAGTLEAIPQDLGRVFLNMVSNSCYATAEKRKEHVTAGDGSYMPTVWLSTMRSENEIVVTIRDNANGMPPEVVEKIFNPFFTTKPTGHGTGLGLALCSDILREHGGAIEVDSVVGEGTTMQIHLPLESRTGVSTDDDDDDEASPAPAPAAVAAAPADGATAEVVAVDGNDAPTPAASPPTSEEPPAQP